MKMSISFVTKTNMTSLKHNNRDLTEAEYQEPAHRHINQELSDDNIYIKRGNLKETYDELFGEALANYNAKQKRADRKITDYYQHVKKSKTLDLQREIVVTVGKKEDWENLSQEDKKAVAGQLEGYINEFEQRHPHLHIYNAVIHMDEEGAPHAHFNIVPVATGYKNGLEKQPSFKKALQNEGYREKGRGQLKEFRDKEIHCLEEKLQSLGIERQKVGTNDIKDMHEYKEIVRQASKELDQNLILDYNAPTYFDETKQEFYTAEEYLGALEYPAGETFRETTVQEKLDWVKAKQLDELKQLEAARIPLEDDIRNLTEVLKEKYDELSKVDSKMSESLSELSEAKNYINTLEKHSKGLEAKIEHLERDSLKLEQQKAQLTDLKIMSEKELATIQPKKGLLGKEHVDLTKEQFEELKGLIYRSKNLVHQKELENNQLRQQVPLRGAKNSFEASLQRAKEKAKGESIDRLKNEIKELKTENSVLRQQNDKMLGKLKELMPDKTFKNLLTELKSIQPIVKIVKRVIEKGLGL